MGEASTPAAIPTARAEDWSCCWTVLSRPGGVKLAKMIDDGGDEVVSLKFSLGVVVVRLVMSIAVEEVVEFSKKV